MINQARLPLAIALSATLAITVTSCADSSSPSSDKATQHEVRAVKRDITDALALNATVKAGVSYATTAPSAGVLRQAGQRWVFTSEDATVRNLDVPSSATEVVPLVPLGTEVKANTPILRVIDSAMLLVAQLSATQILRLGSRVPALVRAEIDGSSGAFTCSLSDSRPTFGDDGSATLSCRLPRSVPAVVGATGQVVLVLAQEKDVLSLPIEAVDGTIANGSVYLRSDPRNSHRIALGITDGVYVEVKSGLSERDVVLEPSPSITSN